MCSRSLKSSSISKAPSHRACSILQEFDGSMRAVRLVAFSWLCLPGPSRGVYAIMIRARPRSRTVCGSDAELGSV
jgi:hypothetical protein